MTAFNKVPRQNNQEIPLNDTKAQFTCLTYGSVNDFMDNWKVTIRKYLQILNFPVVRKVIYGSVSEAGELGLKVNVLYTLA